MKSKSGFLFHSIAKKISIFKRIMEFIIHKNCDAMK